MKVISLFRSVLILITLYFQKGNCIFGLDLTTIGCTTVVGASSFDFCLSHYKKDIQRQDRNFGDVNNCCALAALQSCVSYNIKEICGEDAERVTKNVLQIIVKAARKSGEDGCVGNEFYLRKESPVCWSDSLKCIGLGVLGLLLVGFSFFSCCRCCCSPRQKPHSTLHLSLIAAESLEHERDSSGGV